MKFIVPKGIATHPAVDSCEYGPSTGVEGYKYAVWLKDGWTFAHDRMEGCQGGHFNSVSEFNQAKPIRA